jgi:serine/threonine-protein kinase
MPTEPDSRSSRLLVRRRTPGRPLDSLDPLFIERAGQRLRVASLVLAGTMFAALVITFVVAENLGWTAPENLVVTRAAAIGIIILSLGMWLLSRSPDMGARLLLDVGLVYEVLAALGLALPAFFNSEGPPTNLIHIPWVCIWVILFPMIVPARPLKNAIAGFAAATTVPLAYGLWLASGNEPPPIDVIVYSFLPAYLCAALAVIPAAVVHELGSTIARTRHELRDLGSYRLTELLGEGGMGEVWRAEHAMLARPAAVKLIKANKLSDMTPPAQHAALLRFEREAKTTASLQNPHTIELYDFGVADDGTLYYVMELLDGMDLDRMVWTHEPLPPERIVYLLRQVCESLAEAHAAGLIHRDIKPANIYVCRHGLEYDIVKVLDFGLVKAMTDTDARLTADNVVMGTFAFMPPEAARGRHSEVDPRSDIYALGAVAYWMLTGQHVFSGDSAASVMYAHVHEPPERPSARVGTEIPQALETIVLDCLAKDRSNRPQSAVDLSDRLAATGLAAAWTQQRAEAWWNTRAPRPGASSTMCEGSA